MAFNSLDEAKERFTKLFHETDTDNSGTLSINEFKSMISKSGYNFTDEQIKQHFNSLDIDGDNAISLEEFLQAMTGIPLVDHRRAIWRKAFVAWDADNSGDVDRQELKQVFRDVIGREISEPELDRVFVRLDKDGSGKIEWEEFVDYFSNLSKAFC
ncbi:hypothetical protein LSH36_499g02033 [Paralvinella palmiformis]|uniref:EF-hand domain-containing protein n=1 Tax=Paralvinella palmiformis TaxID=53620 RepID=A0AAD9J8H3_9ANNE|nr:hypothetical protein LSH36_499g02033 [Paralvinella palmiformis]